MSAEPGEAKTFFLKMQGDYYRHFHADEREPFTIYILYYMLKRVEEPFYVEIFTNCIMCVTICVAKLI